MHDENKQTGLYNDENGQQLDYIMMKTGRNRII